MRIRRPSSRRRSPPRTRTSSSRCAGRRTTRRGSTRSARSSKRPAPSWRAATPTPRGSRRRRPVADLLGKPLAVANAGVDLFADELERQDVPVERVEWRPPEPGSEAALATLALEAAQIARANDEAVERIEAAQPHLVGVGTARDLLPDMTDRTILHAGPPIEWADMSGPLRGAVIGAAVYEGLASDREDAERRAAAGEFAFGSCHERGAVGPMAGVVSPSMPMWVIENTTHGNRAFCTFNEGLGKVLRYGANDDSVLERLAWIRDILARVFSRALDRLEPIDLRSMTAQALQM